MSALVKFAKAHWPYNKNPRRERSPADSHRRGWRERFHIKKKVQHGSAEPSRADVSPRTPTSADSQAHSTGVQPDPRPSAHSSPVGDNETPTPPVTVSLVNVENLALAANIAEKIGNVMGKVPLVAPVAALLSEIVKTYKEIKDMHEKRNALLTRITDLAKNLHGTIMRMEATKYVDGMGRLKSDIEGYVELLRRASALASDFDSHGVFKTGVNQKQWTDKFTALDGELNLFAGRFVGNRVADFQIEQSRIGHKVDDVQLLALEQKLEKWLQNPPDMKKKQDDTQELHHAGTGSWFLDSQQFNEWKEKSGSLWIKGNSGTGKSVLSSVVIKKLFKDRQPSVQGTVAVAYFYFDFRDEERQFVKNMLQSIIMQLSAQSPNPYLALDRLYNSSNGQTLPTYEQLLGILNELLLELSRAYIVLDALDECTDPDLLIKFISSLRGWTRSPLHLLFTSQPREMFTVPFDGVEHIVLEPDTVRYDIQLFVSSEVHSKLEKLKHLKHWKDRTAEIITKVVEKSSGMFRLAACLLIEIARPKLKPNLDAILTNLPNDLHGIYDRFLEGIDADDFVSVETVLRWLVFSARPLRLPELEDTLAFDFSDPQNHVYDPSKRDDYANRVCELLDGLITVSEPPAKDPRLFSFKADDEVVGLVVSLAHASVVDYLVSRAFGEKFRHYDLDEARVHTFIAQSCVGYLFHFADHPLKEETFPNYPLSSYAARYWIHHLLLCHDRAVLSTSTKRLLQSGTEQYLALNHLYNPDRPWDGRDWTRNGRSPLYMCSLFGYTEGVHFLLEEGADVNAAERHYGSALQATSAEGFTEIVRLLLEKGADVNTAGGRYGSALQAASAVGYTEIVRLLLENGADANAAGGEYGSALQTASAEGHTEIVRLLLENDADVNTAGGVYGRALQAGSANGNTEIVRMLLEKGADVNAAGGGHNNALQDASAKGHTDVVRLLLENSADVNAGKGRFGSPLQSASARGYTEIVHLLLENDADVNAAGGYYGNALQAASAEGHTEIVRLLLENGVDVNTKGGKYGSVLQAASAHGDTDTVRMLLENGAEVNPAGGKYGSALQAASAKGHTDVVRLLFEKGADVNTVGGEYGSALQAACMKGDIAIMHLLLEKGADVNAAGGEYGSALQAACMKGDIAIMHLLLEKGADVNAAGGKYGSALQAACAEGHTEIVRLLLEKGADVNAAGGEYGSALQTASAHDQPEIVRLLLEKGGDINAAGGPYGSTLQAASANGDTDTVRLLLEKGADVNAGGGVYGSALQAACTESHIDIVRLLLEKGADVNAGGGEYGSVLQAASTNGDTDVVRVLLENGAHVNAAGGAYGSALQAACMQGYTDVVCLLLENGADINATGGKYGSALQAASVFGHREIVHLLLEKGADVNAVGGEYGSALRAACVQGHTKIMRLLLENGAIGV
ncbi:ankyrin repeat-containing domain protein [Mycena epipterygia]|nr:ankyrin repeat-containing domain protein [Mycena epipterygia]